MNGPALPPYLLVTPARDEAALIGQTIEAMLRQSHRPLCWVIVSDGSTDGTDEIVRHHAQRHPWIRLLRMPERAERHFAGKALAFMAAYETFRSLPFEIVGNLDADICVDDDHFEYLLRQFADRPGLGVAGTPFREGEVQYDYRFTCIEHVSGACQMFRRACFESIGGYRPMRCGGIDWAAVTTARMRGWQTRTFTDRHCRHHRPMGSAGCRLLQARWRLGRKDYLLGGHPLWQAVRCLYQMRVPPRGIGAACLLAGYCWAALTRAPRSVDDELMRFHRAEQLQRLRRALQRAASRRGQVPA